MNRSTPGLPVQHQLPEFTQTHVHRVGDAIQPSHPLSSPSPPAPNPSQHQSLFQRVNSSHEVAKVGSDIQCPVITYNEKNLKKNVCVCIYLLCIHVTEPLSVHLQRTEHCISTILQIFFFNDETNPSSDSRKIE